MVCIFQVTRNRGTDFYKPIIITRLPKNKIKLYCIIKCITKILHICFSRDSRILKLTNFIISLITTTLFQLFIFTWRQNPNFSYLILMIQKNTYRLPYISL